jgi:hypothetical protein
MKLVFRVNNEFFGVLHRSVNDVPEDPEDPDNVPSMAILPKECTCRDLSEHGFAKGDPIQVEFNEKWEVIAVGRVDQEPLWKKAVS